MSASDPDFTRPEPFLQGQACSTSGVRDYDTYEFHLNSPSYVTASTCGGASWDTVLVIYQAPGGARRSPHVPNGCFEAIAANDDACSLQSTISASLTAGYFYVVVTSYSAGQGGSYTLSVSGLSGCATPPPTSTPPTGCGYQGFLEEVSSTQAQVAVRPPAPDELIPMSKAAVNPAWGMPDAPSPHNTSPMNRVVNGMPDQPESSRRSGAPGHQAPDNVSVGAGSSDFMWKTYTPGQTGGTAQRFYDVPTARWYGPFCGQNGGTIAQAPAISEYRGQFQVVGLGTDGQLYQAYYNPPPDNRWYGWYRLSVPSPYSSGFNSAPAVAVYRGQFHVFARGSDSGIWHAFFDWASNRWYGWNPVGGIYTSSASAPAVTAYTGNNDRNELHLVYMNSSSPYHLVQMIFNGSGSNAWTNPFVLSAGPWTSAPSITQYNNQLIVGAVDVDAIWYHYHTPGIGWVFNVRLTNSVGSAPAFTQYLNQLQVFYVEGYPSGSWNGHQMYYVPGTGWWDGGRFSDRMSSSPAITPYLGQFQVWWRHHATP